MNWLFGNSRPSWCEELIILSSPRDAANALESGGSLKKQVMYVWNKATTDDDLEGFLKHRSKTKSFAHPLIIVGGAHGYRKAVDIGVGASPNRSDWGRGFRPNEFQEAKIIEAMRKYLNIYYVDVSSHGFEEKFARLWGQFPNADLMICVCWGLATDLAKQMRDRGLSCALAKKSENQYVKVRVNWDTVYTDEYRISLNRLARRI
jgi:hypothetical protein